MVNVFLGLTLVYGLIGLFTWLVGLVAAERRGNFRSVSDVALYVVLGLFIACVYWPFGILFFKQDLEDIRGLRG